MLDEHDDRMTRCNSRPDEVDEQWRHIRDVLGGADDIFERLQILLLNIGNRLQNCRRVSGLDEVRGYRLVVIESLEDTDRCLA